MSILADDRMHFATLRMCRTRHPSCLFIWKYLGRANVAPSQWSLGPMARSMATPSALARAEPSHWPAGPNGKVTGREYCQGRHARGPRSHAPLWRQPDPERHLHGGALGEVTCVMGTNGVGKTSLLKAISGTHARSGGTLPAGWRGDRRAPAHHPGPQGHRLRAAGPRYLPAADGEGEPRDRLCLPAP